MHISMYIIEIDILMTVSVLSRLQNMYRQPYLHFLELVTWSESLSLDAAADTVRSIRTFDLKNASIDSLIQKSKVLTKICTYEELDIDIVEKWLEQGDKNAIISKNNYNELWKEYPAVAFHGSTMSKELIFNNKLLKIRNRTLYDLVKY